MLAGAVVLHSSDRRAVPAFKVTANDGLATVRDVGLALGHHVAEIGVVAASSSQEVLGLVLGLAPTILHSS